MNELKFTGERLTGENSGWIRAEHLHRYALAGKYVKDKKVLDIACGEGYGTYLLGKSALQVFGMDIDEKVIRFAKEKYKKDNLEFKPGNIENTGFKDYSFDIIISFETIEHLDNHIAAMNEIKRILKPDGILIMSTPDRDKYNFIRSVPNRFHLHEMNFEEYKTMLNQYFEHNRFLFQQSVAASFIYSVDINNFSQFSGSLKSISAQHNPDFTYIISVSGNHPFELPPHSVFKDESLTQDKLIFKNKSLDYKIGKMILDPLRKIKRWIGR
jgi:ubiquinone/menaquinone biosynthesis C-methylase UbiE